MCHVRKRQIAIQTAGWPWPPGVPDFKTSFTCSVVLGYFPESFNVLWPQQWNINYCENLGALACEVSILSSVMGCLCSGPKNRLQTRKRSLPCQGDRAEQEGKMWGWLGTASPMVWQAGKHLPWETEPPKNTWITLVAPGAAQEMGDGHDSLSWSVPSCPGVNCFWALCHAYLRHSPDLLCADTRRHKWPACCWVCCLLWMF